MKTLIVVEHRAHELANQLWNDMSIYAYARETNARFINTTRFEHGPLAFLHLIYARIIDRLMRRTCCLWATGAPKYLSPNSCDATYFFGWMFRNPCGMEKYRKEICARFAPPRAVSLRIDKALENVTDKILIGIHLKQKPFKGFPDGEFLVQSSRVYEIAREYVREHALREEDVAFIEVSDTGPYKDSLEGLYLLSRCSVVIGDNSTFSNLAAWLGNVPHIVTTDDVVDWQYYHDKNTYFDNKYATFAFGSLVAE